MYSIKQHLANLWLILALSVFAWAPLLTPAYFFKAHDARHTVFYLVEFDQTFRDGFGWPRWSPDFAFGYGYPLFNIYAPLAIYAAEILHLLGLSFIDAVKTMFILATISSGFGMYGLTRALFGNSAGLLAALVYIYVPFHLVDIFVRNAYAEYVALAVVPFVFWAFTNLIAAPLRPKKWDKVVLAGLVYAILALTHHTSFFTFTPFLMVYIVYLIVAKTGLSLFYFIKEGFYALSAGIWGVAVAAIYLLPTIVEKNDIKVEQWTSGSYNYLDHFVYFSQFFSPMWGYGYAGVGLQDDFSYQLGVVAMVLVSFALLFRKGEKTTSSTSTFKPHMFLKPVRFWEVKTLTLHANSDLFFLGLTVVVILLMSPMAAPIWKVIPLAMLVQFPWRLLGVTAFTMSIVAGALLASSSNLVAQKSMGYLLLLVVVLASFPYTLPQYTEIPDGAETPLAVINWDRESITDRVGMVSVTEKQPQTSPMEQQYLNHEPLTVAEIIIGHGSLETLHHGGASSQVKVSAPEPITVQFYTYDYPGWQVTLDGQPLEHRYQPPFGLITVDVPSGDHVLYLRMGSTPIRTIGTIISGLALLVTMYMLIF